MDYGLGIMKQNNVFPPQLSFGYGVYNSSREQARTVLEVSVLLAPVFVFLSCLQTVPMAIS